MATLKIYMYADERGRLVETSDPEADPVEFCPQGGGFVNCARRAVFHATFKPADEPQFAPARFTGEWMPEGTALAGYTNGLRWNGWACPYFTKEEALRLVEDWPGLFYDEARDAFVRPCEGGDPDETEVFGAETITVAGQPLKVYPVGSGSWCWEEAPAD